MELGENNVLREIYQALSVLSVSHVRNRRLQGSDDFQAGCNQGGVFARWAHNGGEIFQMLGNQICCKRKSLNFRIRHNTHYLCH